MIVLKELTYKVSEIFYFCASIWELSFFLFPIVIFLWCIVLLFVLINMKSSWMIVLTFIACNPLDACLCWMVAWDRIIAPKTEVVLGQVSASLIHNELQQFLTIIHIMIFLTHDMDFDIFSLPLLCLSCCICFHSSVSVIWSLCFVHETVKKISRKHRVCYKNCLFFSKESSQDLQILHSSLVVFWDSRPIYSIYPSYSRGIWLVSCTVYLEYLEHSK